MTTTEQKRILREINRQWITLRRDLRGNSILGEKTAGRNAQLLVVERRSGVKVVRRRTELDYGVILNQHQKPSQLTPKKPIQTLTGNKKEERGWLHIT